MNTFESWLVRMRKSEIDFILVGGLAVDLCGYARSTLDMDILISLAPENIERLLEALRGFGSGSGGTLESEDFAPQEGCIRINEDFPLDIFSQMQEKRYEDLLPWTRPYELKGHTIRHLSPEGIILLKSGSVRPKDQLDVSVMQDILEKEKSD